MIVISLWVFFPLLTFLLWNSRIGRALERLQLTLYLSVLCEGDCTLPDVSVNEKYC